MKKNIFIILSFFVCLFTSQNAINAAIVDTIIAKQVGINYLCAYKSKIFNAEIDIKNISVQKTEVVTENSKPVYYIFSIANGGFVLVSADDAVTPILGFSTEGDFKTEKQPEVIKEWMNNYSKQILSARQNNIKANDEINETWNYYSYNCKFKEGNSDAKGINPLITTKWDQGINYNYFCPQHYLGPGGKCYAGCVATAMAQIMKYWNYPEFGYGSHSYYHPHFNTISVDFSSQQYEWNKMTNVISSASKEAIATLIYNCGVAVDMNYTPLSSGSFIYLAKDAFRNYFHYRLTTQYVQRFNYDSISWNEIIMNNLDDGIPVLYSGSGSSGGHAFVCDGYADNAYFHFNWGWSGANNGFFAINNLNSNNGDFTSDQSAVINIVPINAPYCMQNKEYSKNSAQITDGSGYSMYESNTNCSWLINSPTPNYITIKFNSFDTEEGKDVVYIYDGNSNNAPLLGAFSGHNLPPVLATSGTNAFIEFITDENNSYQGWDLTYTTDLVNIEEFSDNITNFNIFPNPVSDKVNITFDAAIPENYKLNIYDISGKQIIDKKISKGTYELSVNTEYFAKGAYILTISSISSGLYKNNIIIK